MLQEAVQRKLEGARSPQNGEQQNGICDGRFSPSAKRRRKEVPGMDTLNNLSNMPLPSVSPLHQLDIKPHIQNSGINSGGLEDISKNGGQHDIKLAVNGSSDLEESLNILQSKDMKQEPLDDASVIDTSETSLSNQNKLFSDINLNDQEWQELIDELANTVPEDDIQDLFNEDFEEKKELDFPRPSAQTPLPQEIASVKSDPSHSPFPSVSIGSPQVRPSSSGPSFSNVSSVSSIPSVSSAPSTLMLAGSPASYVVQSPQTPTQPHTPGQPSSRSGNGYAMNSSSNSGSGSVNLPSADLSPAEQLKQMAAQQQQRAKLIQQKQQQHTNQPSNWSPVRPPSSPYGGAYGTEKPNSPMMYPQVFNNQPPIVSSMANNPPKTTMNNYLPQSHMNMANQQTNNLGTNSIGKPSNMLSYGNTKPLSHFSAEMSQRMTPPLAGQNKTSLIPYIQQQQPMQQQMSHLSEEQKRLLIMKQKGLMNQSMGYPSLSAHAQCRESRYFSVQMWDCRLSCQKRDCPVENRTVGRRTQPPTNKNPYPVPYLTTISAPNLLLDYKSKRSDTHGSHLPISSGPLPQCQTGPPGYQENSRAGDQSLDISVKIRDCGLSCQNQLEGRRYVCKTQDFHKGLEIGNLLKDLLYMLGPLWLDYNSEHNLSAGGLKECKAKTLLSRYYPM
ncbi:hypothetical protein XELAEV_18005555mg [Xenopus laevis]|uniref:Mastermind-like 1/3 transactivation domain-containing protein n=1 Tax=Xenopus laevis TaxID=8355 RepID=A0A974DX27_XENLA|nr:hypothetical protein XELAEV_18005555mg [Xenopus laevis]